MLFILCRERFNTVPTRFEVLVFNRDWFCIKFSVSLSCGVSFKNNDNSFTGNLRNNASALKMKHIDWHSGILFPKGCCINSSSAQNDQIEGHQLESLGGLYAIVVQC